MKLPLFSRLVSPVGLLVVSAAISAGYAVCHAAGWRVHVSVFSGTIAPSNGGTDVQFAKAAAYSTLYFATVLLVPVLTLGALMQVVVLRLLSRRPARTLAVGERPGH